MIEKQKKELLISACLLGIPCRWNGTSKESQKALKLYFKGGAVPVCPEVIAGLATPRPPCEIIGGDGKDVLNGTAKVMDETGKDYSKYFIKGVQKTLALAKKLGVKIVVLKSGSPSCGAKKIYSGKFDGSKRKGFGVTAALLKKHGIKIIEV
ncbi:MAG: DUF523 domain-containing protein [Candidatus Komeilibacteria bacterium]|nr:DUF523 domain-containing protein [Candidatus Komeilibacteria bacterium]